MAVRRGVELESFTEGALACWVAVKEPTRSYHDRVTESQSLETKNALPRGAELADTGHILRQRPYGRAVPFEASRWYPNCASACLVP